MEESIFNISKYETSIRTTYTPEELNALVDGLRHKAWTDPPAREFYNEKLSDDIIYYPDFRETTSIAVLVYPHGKEEGSFIARHVNTLCYNNYDEWNDSKNKLDVNQDDEWEYTLEAFKWGEENPIH